MVKDAAQRRAAASRAAATAAEQPPTRPTSAPPVPCTPAHLTGAGARPACAAGSPKSHAEQERQEAARDLRQAWEEATGRAPAWAPGWAQPLLALLLWAVRVLWCLAVWTARLLFWAATKCISW